MSNNNSAEFNGQHLKTTTKTVAEKTTTTTTTVKVDEKLRISSNTITGNTAAAVNVGSGGACEGTYGGIAASVSVSASGCDKADSGDTNNEGAVGCKGDNTGFDVGGSCDDVGAASWLAMQMYNNNLMISTDAATATENFTQQQMTDEALRKWWVDGNGVAHKFKSSEYAESAACTVEDKGGGLGEEASYIEQERLNGERGRELSTGGSVADNSMHVVDLDYEYAMAAAATLTPPDNNSHSNRTSLNNSTENLSYNSDNYYPDDIILLDEDIDAEEVSLNSDDCIYAYRGDGDELEFAVLNAKNVKTTDDETDFLEMDFEPDPLSEVEYGDACSVRTEPTKSHANALLLQRNSCHISSSNGRHSANMDTHVQSIALTTSAIITAPAQRQHFSSPIDDLPTQAKCLQTQAMLSKNFARINLHLDQINSDTIEVGDIDKELSNVDTVALIHGGMVDITARSLPNTLNAYIGRDGNALDELNKTPAKVTGAKPKRLSRFSSTSSTSSKTSTKSRNSLRSSLTTAICSSVSFDERSVSCNDFRTAPLTCEDATTTSATNPIESDTNTNDETCLDCLENEFLANTIGKVLETNKCAKCNKRRNSMSYYNHQSNDQRCRSGSPTYFLEYAYQREEILFDEFSATTCKKWVVPVQNTSIADENRDGILNKKHFCIGQIDTSMINQRRKQRDNYKEEQLLKNLTMTEPEIKMSTINLTEDILVQALDKLHITYNIDLIKSHFKLTQLTADVSRNTKNFRNLLHFLLYESKKNCNHPKLKRLIEIATRKQIEVTFKEDSTIIQPEMISVKVADILHQWTRNKNLELLKQLDKRFRDANIMGKIANIIRQTHQQRTTTRRPLLEFLSIPQFYPSGELTLCKKC